MSYIFMISSFVAGFSLMALELVSARVVAPLVGSSVFTWTSVIGVTLLGLSLGSFVGGVAIDRKPHSVLLGSAFSASALFVFLIPSLVPFMDTVIHFNFSLPVLVLLVSFLIFFLPSFSIGLLQPMILKLFARDLNKIGKEYGILSALWSLGSIVGVFATGFYFVSEVGSTLTLYSISALLAFCGVYFLYHAHTQS